MNKVQLQHLPYTNLQTVYARKVGDKIIHYHVGGSASIIFQLIGLNSTYDLVKKYIENTEGPTEFELIEQPNNSTEDYTDKVLGDLPKIRKIFDKKPEMKLLNVYHFTFFDKLKRRINNLGRKLGFTKMFPKHFDLRSDVDYIPITFLGYSFNSEEENEAVKLLREDLKKLYDGGYLLGYLSKPTVLTTTDLIGFGNSRKILYCFVNANTYRLQQKTKNFNYLKTPFKDLLGIKGETIEGGTGFNIPASKKIEPEIVIVNDENIINQDEQREMLIKQYGEQQDLVKDIASKQRQFLKDFEKVESKTETEFVVAKNSYDQEYQKANKVNVDVTFQKKANN